MTEPEELLSEDEFVEQVEEPTPSGFDRSSGQVARRILEKLLPDEEVRLEVLSFFAQAILTAHEQGESKWGVTLYPYAVALNVSGFYACWVRSTDFFVSFMEDTLSPELLARLKDKVQWDGTFKRLPGSRIVYIPYSQSNEVLPQMVTPTKALIVFAGTRYGQMGAKIEGAHSPGVLQYLREYLETDLPEPTYASAVDAANIYTARREALPASDVLETECLKDPSLRTVTPVLADAMKTDIGIVRGNGIPCMVSIGEFMRPARIVGFDSRPDPRLEAKYGSLSYPGIAMIREATGEAVWHKMTRRTVMIAEALALELEKSPSSIQEDEEYEDTVILSDTPNFWKIAPGENGFLWDQCREQGCILIGWPKVGDIRGYPNKEALALANTEFNHKKASTTILWRFAHDIKIGDIIVANKGNRQVIGIGVVTSDYLPPHSPHNPSTNADYPNARLVDWRIVQPVTLSRAYFGQIPLTLQWIYPARWNDIRAAYLAQYQEDAALRDALHKLTEDVAATLVPPVNPVPEAVKPLLKMAERTRNILLYGPPGTGKTWLVTQFAKAFTDTNKAEMVTFHQSFAYEEFIEGIKPVIADHGQVAYDVQDGVFKRICRAAQANPSENYLLVIDEINRANIAKVLGELITLIEDDKRLGEANETQATLPYSGEKFGVPKNLTILGTMNTADRSIALLDLALRRRFTFVEMPPDPSLLPLDVAGVNLQALLTRLNQRVAALLDPDHRIGHSYLMNVKTEDDLHFAWYHRVLPLLQEYFYHDGERMQAVVGKAFIREAALDAETKEALGAAYDETAQYETVLLMEEAFLSALQKIAGQ